jgi:hypothetical protein
LLKQQVTSTSKSKELKSGKQEIWVEGLNCWSTWTLSSALVPLLVL